MQYLSNFMLWYCRFGSYWWQCCGKWHKKLMSKHQTMSKMASKLPHNVQSSYTIHPCRTIRIFHEYEVRIEKFFQGSLFGIMRLCRVMPNSDPAGRIFLSAPNNHDRFFFLHTLWSPAFDFNIGVAINEWRSYMLTTAILRVDVLCDVTMTSQWCHNDVNSQRLNDRVTWPPIQPMYWQHMLLLVFLSTPRVR